MLTIYGWDRNSCAILLKYYFKFYYCYNLYIAMGSMIFLIDFIWKDQDIYNMSFVKCFKNVIQNAAKFHLKNEEKKLFKGKENFPKFS